MVKLHGDLPSRAENTPPLKNETVLDRGTGYSLFLTPKGFTLITEMGDVYPGSEHFDTYEEAELALMQFKMGV